MRVSRYSGRRYLSAFGASSRPHCASGVFTRTAVSTSCRRLRRRACICTSPAATSGRPVVSLIVCSASSCAASSMPRVSSQAIQLAPGFSSTSQRASRMQRVGVERFAPVAQRQQQGQHVVEPLGVRLEVGRAQAVTALDRLPPAQRHQLAQVAVAGTCLRQQHELGARRRPLAFAFGQLDLGAVDQPEGARRLVVLARFLQCQVRAHRAGERTLVGDRQPGVLECQRAFDQFLGMRRTAQEREVAEAVQLGVRNLHGVRSSIPVRARNERALCLS